MWSLAEAQKMTNDILLKGIIDTIIKESPILKKMKFLTVQGNGWTYNRETTMPGAGWYSVGDEWVESSGTRTQYTAALKTLGGDTDIDLFEKQTMSDQNDLEAINIEEKSKAIAHEFEDVFVYGSSSANAKQFDGLHTMLDSAMDVNLGTDSTGAALSLAALDQMIDLIKPGRPDALIMNKTVRRRLKNYYRDGTSGMGFSMERGEDGIPMESYGNIPIFVNDFIVQTEAISSGVYNAQTGGLTSSIFAMQFGPKKLTGIQNGGIQKEFIGKLEKKNAERWRIKWYVSVALLSIYSLARLDGITDAAATD